MDIVNKVMNIEIPPIALTLLLFFLPPYLFYKFFVSRIVRPLFRENVAGKVVLITGASSGIGEVSPKLNPTWSVFFDNFLS